MGLLLVALSPPYAIWCCSGLENPRYVLLIALLLACTVAALSVQPEPRIRDAVIAGLLAGLVAATRPDGVTYAALWPVSVLLGASGPVMRRLRAVLLAVITSLVCIAGLAIWRWSTFHDFVPNSYHAKGEPIASEAPEAALLVFVLVVAIASGRWLAQPNPRLARVVTVLLVMVLLGTDHSGSVYWALAGPVGSLVFGLILTSAIWCPRFAARLPWLGLVLLGLFAYLALPEDWMGQHRFATPLLMAATVWGTVEVVRVVSIISVQRWRHVAASGFIAAAVLHLSITGTEAINFAARPPVPMSQVEKHFRQKHTRWAEDMSCSDAFVLIPDVGGALWARTLPIIDLGGLFYREIAQLFKSKPEKLRNYILDQVQPAIINIHGPRAYPSGLSGDEKFQADYVPVFEGPVLSRLAGRDLNSGDYVRRELIGSDALLRKWRLQTGRK